MMASSGAASIEENNPGEITESTGRAGRGGSLRCQNLAPHAVSSPAEMEEAAEAAAAKSGWQQLNHNATLLMFRQSVSQSVSLASIA